MYDRFKTKKDSHNKRIFSTYFKDLYVKCIIYTALFIPHKLYDTVKPSKCILKS